MSNGNKEREKNRDSKITAKKGILERLNDALQNLGGYSKRQFLYETDLSIAHYETILRTEPKDKDAWMNLGRLYDKKFMFEKAIESKLKASNICPYDSEIKFSIGCSFCGKGDFSAAIKSYMEALELRPDFAEACEAIGEQYQIIGKAEKAEEWFFKAQEIRFKQAKS